MKVKNCIVKCWDGSQWIWSDTFDGDLRTIKAQAKKLKNDLKVVQNFAVSYDVWSFKSDNLINIANPYKIGPYKVIYDYNKHPWEQFGIWYDEHCLSQERSFHDAVQETLNVYLWDLYGK